MSLNLYTRLRAAFAALLRDLTLEDVFKLRRL